MTWSILRIVATFTFVLYLMFTCWIWIGIHSNKMNTLQDINGIMHIRSSPHNVRNDSSKLRKVNLLKKRSLSDAWQSVDQPATLYVFSAYFDGTSASPVIRIIGISLRNRTQPSVTCSIHGNSTKVQTTTYSRKAYIIDLTEDKGKRYYGVVVICKLSPNDRPFSVSVNMKDLNKGQITNRLTISYLTKQEVEVSVCLPVLTSSYTNMNELIQTVEMARVLGARMFYVYVYSVTPEIRLVLQLYRKQNILRVIKWKLPVTSIQSHGHVAAINDCLYRNVDRTKYMLNMDFNEMVVPRKHDTWSAMMEFVDKKAKGYSAFYFQMANFHKEWESFYGGLGDKNESNVANTFQVQMLYKMWREEKIQPVKYKSKYIVRPEKVETLAAHVVSRYRGQGHFVKVDPQIALLHGYHQRKDNPRRVLDLATRRFSKTLLHRVKETWRLLQEK